MAEQEIATPDGTDGAMLFLDRDRHRLLTALELTEGDAGWQPGDRLFGFAAPWSSSIPWHLGATIPGSIMPTLRTDPERLVLQPDLGDLDGWDGAWMLTTPEAASPTLHGTTMEQAGEVATALGRSFPADSTRVWGCKSMRRTSSPTTHSENRTHDVQRRAGSSLSWSATGWRPGSGEDAIDAKRVGLGGPDRGDSSGP